MTKYYHSIEGLIGYLQEKNEKELAEWLCNLLLYGHTSPLIGVSPDEYPSSIIEDLYLSCNQYSWRNNMRGAIKNVFNKMIMTYDGEAFTELLNTISLLNITELLPALRQYAKNEEFKEITSECLPNDIDLHNMLLKSLFGLNIEKKDLACIMEIAERDKEDLKYGLECFHFLTSHKSDLQCVDYIPLLLEQAKSSNRDYAGVIMEYLHRFRNNICEKLDLILEKLEKADEELLYIFQEILSRKGISLSENDNSILINGFKKKPITVEKPKLFPLFAAQSRNSSLKMLHDGNREETFISDLENLILQRA